MSLSNPTSYLNHFLKKEKKKKNEWNEYKKVKGAALIKN